MNVSTKKHRMYILALITFLLFKSNRAESSEPSCFSRFDYDMKMFETVADTKQNQKTIIATINQLQGFVEKLTTAVSGLGLESIEIKKRLINQDDVIRRQENRMVGQDAIIREQETRISRLYAFSSGIGTTYIRWGRNSCPGNGTSLVYKGIVGGASHEHKGSGSNYQCLPEDPTWGVYQDGTQGSKSYMYGSEYQPYSLHFEAFVGNEVPCAVCLSPRSSMIMIPARTTCYPGWSLEYEGNLASEHYTHHKSQYVCIDKTPEAAFKIDSVYQNGALFYAVEGRCGSLPCPPYVEGRELACVVCTK